MKEPIFLPVDFVLEIHRRSLERYGGLEGMRDEHGLQSALVQPEQTFYYTNGDLYTLAAAYIFHLAQAQAFVDGNKRTAVGAGFAFLKINGARPSAGDQEIYEAVIGIAERRIDRAQLAEVLRGTNG